MNRLDFEKPLKEKAIRLIQKRAGGRFTMFEAGMLYQICLELGYPDCRPGGIGWQEKFWENTISSCLTEKEAKQKLKMLLSATQTEVSKCQYSEFISKKMS
jgi:hypothetical protein